MPHAFCINFITYFRTLEQLHMDFKTAISGCGAADVSTKELTAGPKIKNLFNERSAEQLIYIRKTKC
jgi:hypothetical protein